MELIKVACELGITHFDTAPLYGDGFSERVLGKAVQRERASVTIATKFGLLPRRWVGALGVAGWPWLAGRAALRRAGLISWPPRSFAAGDLRTSVRASLRALRTDYLDILFLHEPLQREIEKNDELFAEMARLKQAGDIRFTGISGPIFPEVMERFGGEIDVLQTTEDGWREGDGLVPDITFGALRREMPAALGQAAFDPCAALARALARRNAGAVIVGTTRVDHLRGLVQAISKAGSGSCKVGQRATPSA